MSIYIEVKVIQHGQPRAYADHEFIQELTFTRDDPREPDYLSRHGLPKVVPYYPPRDQALAVARAFCPYLDQDDPAANWASRFLISFDRLDPTPWVRERLGYAEAMVVSPNSSDKWRIHVRSAFTD